MRSGAKAAREVHSLQVVGSNPTSAIFVEYDDYLSVAANRTFTVPTRYVYIGEAEPLFYDLCGDDE